MLSSPARMPMDSNTEDIKRYFNVVAESLRSEIRLLAEGQGGTNERLDRVEGRFEQLDVRLDRMEVRLDGVEVRLDGVGDRLDGVGDRLDRFEAAVAAEFKAVRADMSEMKAMIRLSFGQLDSRLTSLEGDVQSLRSRLDRLEGRSQA